MNRVYRFAIKLDDLLTSPLARMSRMYGSTISRMEQGNRRVNSSLGRMAGSVVGGFRRAFQSVDQLRRGLVSLPSRLGLSFDTSGITRARREVDGLRDAQGRLRDSRGRFVPGGGGGGRSGGGMFSGFGLGGLVGGYLGIAGLKMAAGQTIMPAMEAERNRFTTGIMLNNHDKAKDLDDQYRSYAKLNPVLGYKDVQAAGTQLVGLEEKYERIMPIIKMMSDVSVGSNNNLQDLMIILGQVKMKGRLQAEEGLQFAERRVNIMPYLAKALGKKSSDLPDLMKDGKISYENVLRAMSMMTGKGGIFEGISEKVGAHTTQGKYASMTEDLEQRAMELGVKLLPTVNKFLAFIGDFIEKAEGPFAKAFTFLGEKMDTFAGGLRNLFIALNVIDEKGTTTEGTIKVLAGVIGGLGVAAKITGDFLSGFAQFVGQVLGLFRTIFNFPRDPFGALSGKYWNAQQDAPAAKPETDEEKFRRQGRQMGHETKGWDAYVNAFFGEQRLSDPNRDYQDQQAKLKSRRSARRLRLGENEVDTTGLLGSGDLQDGKKKKGSKDSSGLDATVSGSRSTNITINLKSLVDGGVHVHSATVKEGLAEIRDMVIDEFTRVLNSANALPS